MLTPIQAEQGISSRGVPEGHLGCVAGVGQGVNRTLVKWRRSAVWNFAAVIAAVFACALTAGGAQAQDLTKGSVTGLPVPRYVSLKANRVNLREGPSTEHRTSWVFQRAGLPVEITAEFDTWRRIRDSDGSEGWVLHSFLSSRRTALIMPWSKNKAETITLFERADDKAAIVAKLQPGVIASVKNCSGSWCRVLGEGFDGYIRQDRLWGVYPNDRVE
jgi:SH3-like domain-containing protein